MTGPCEPPLNAGLVVEPAGSRWRDPESGVIFGGAGVTPRSIDFTNTLSNLQVGGDPVTPVFTAQASQPVRLRLVQPGGHTRNNVFLLHGHIWEEEPYVDGSLALGANPRSHWIGSMYGVGPGSHFDFLLKNGAGGKFAITGDYLWRTFHSSQFNGGIWGLFRVCAPDATCQPCPPGQYCTDVCTSTQ